MGIKFFIFLSMIALSNPLAAMNWPKTMAAMGDSITEGMLASYALERGLPSAEYFRMMQIAQMEQDLRLSAFRKNYAQRELSWATGTRKNDLVRSHYERILEHESEAKAWNFSVSGAHSINLLDQVEEMRRVVKDIPGGFDYIVILIASNDLLGKSLAEIGTPFELQANLDLAIDEILRLSPRARLLVSGPPKIFEIFETSKDIAAVKLLNYSISCGQLRKQIYGDRVIFKPEESENYEAAKEILNSYWRVIRELPDRLAWRFPEAEIKVVEIPKSQQKPEKLLTVDCFHPSEWGQAELAANIWKLGFWGSF